MSAPSVFEWSDVKYGVGKGDKAKEILHGISGSLNGGEVCAILGPSGAGKTSLLNVLANRIRDKGGAQRVSGTVRLDGKELVGQELRKRIAYVMQQDLLFATQTPREALLFSAQLRLPNAMPMSEKRDLVEKMLADLGLLGCADTYCGSEMIRGISGGEKKRTAIGVELVMQPELIFLDEPTSGLDSFAAQNVCAKIVDLARNQGCNVLCTIHQPSSEVFHTFGKTMILYKGKALYFGSIHGLSSGLTANGVGCPAEYNLADHIITVTQTKSVEELDKLRDAFAEGKFGADTTAVKGSEDAMPEVPETPPTDAAKKEAAALAAKHASGRSAGFFTQLKVLTLREAKYIWRDKAGLAASIIAPLLLNVIFACIFTRNGDSTWSKYDLKGHYGAVSQVFIGGMFGAAQPLLLRFPLDRGIFLREYATSTYGAAPYFISKSCVELPQFLLNAVLVWTAYYWIVGLQGNWFLHVLIFWMSGIAAASTALLIGCLAPNAEVAQQSAPGVFVLQLLFGGVFLPVNNIPAPLRWLQYLASLKYAINLSVLNEFGADTQRARNWSVPQRTAANAVIAQNDIDPNMWWFYLMMIIILFTFFRVLSILALAKRAAAFF